MISRVCKVFCLQVTLLLVCFAQSGIEVLSTELNEGAFSIRRIGRDGFCFVGRKDTLVNGYDAVLGVCGQICKVFSVSSQGEDYSYTVELFEERCVAGITTTFMGNMDIALTVFGMQGVERVSCLGGAGEDMLWYVRKVEDGYLAVGGVQEGNWDILILKLDTELRPLWVKRLGTRKEEYAYGVTGWKKGYLIVGRSNYQGNWDAFVMELDKNGKLLRSYLMGSKRKDYLRFISLWRGEPLAVGRTEGGKDSDVFILLPRSGLYRVYDGGEDDYGRAFSETSKGLVVVGDAYREGEPDGMLLFLDEGLKVMAGYSVGGQDVESIRFVDGNLVAGYTYSITLDNDMLLGRVDISCGSFVREKVFKEVKVKMEFYPFPVKEVPYKIAPVECEFEIKDVFFRKIDPCQE